MSDRARNRSEIEENKRDRIQRKTVVRTQNEWRVGGETGAQIKRAFLTFRSRGCARIDGGIFFYTKHRFLKKYFPSTSASQFLAVQLFFSGVRLNSRYLRNWRDVLLASRKKIMQLCACIPSNEKFLGL